MKSVALFFLGWMIPTLILFYLPVSQDASPSLLSLITFVAIGFYLILASSLGYRLTIEVFSSKKNILYSYICFSLLVFVSVYFCVRYLGNFSIIVASFSTANLLFFSTILGAMLSSAVKRTAELIPICITAAFADLMSVAKGPTREMVVSLTDYYETGMAGVPPLVDFIVIKIGVPGYTIPMPLFGMTDWIFLVLLSSAMLRLGIIDNLFGSRDNRESRIYFPVAAAALYIGLLWAQVISGFVPAMVFISTIFLLFLFVKLKVAKEVRSTDVYYSILFPALVGVTLFLFVK